MTDLRIIAVAHLYNLTGSDDPRAVPTIVSAPPPARHHNLFALNHDKPDASGFLLNDGTFCGRKRALIIAREAGQLLPGSPTAPPWLFSEDVW